ncbi:MAG: glycosyltransferase [Ignavibacteria bacterium]
MTIFNIFLLIPLANFFITLYNLFTAPALSKNKINGNSAKVSILIPARNEERNIENCLRHVTAQSYSNIEIIVLDDFSKDSTLAKSLQMSETDNRIMVVEGEELPRGWTGKNWACMQLAKKASGDYLLFIDADVTLGKEAVESSIFEMNNLKTDMLSVFPKQIMNSIGEKLTVAILNWLMISFLPLKKVYSSKNSFYAAANGQFMMWKRNVYFETGGHESVKDKIVEDIELSRMLKTKGYKIATLLCDDLVTCRMYSSFSESLAGFTKNYFPSSGLSEWKFISILILIVFSYLYPLILMFDSVLFMSIVGVIILNRAIISMISHQSLIMNTILFPFQLLTMLYIGLRSVAAIKYGNVYWKGRNL